MIIDEEAYVEHFGVKGMHWGVRNEPKRSRSPAEKQARQRRIHNRVRTAARVGASAATLAVIAAGSYYVGKQLGNEIVRRSNIRHLHAVNEANRVRRIAQVQQMRDMGRFKEAQHLQYWHDTLRKADEGHLNDMVRGFVVNSKGVAEPIRRKRRLVKPSRVNFRVGPTGITDVLR